VTAPGPGRLRYKDLCLDAVRPEVMAGFWGPALGLRSDSRGNDVMLVDGVDEHTLWIHRVPEVATVKQRVHLDLHVGSVQDLVDLGAEVVDDTLPWTVLRDPEGGELCAFVRPAERLPRHRLYELVVDAEDPERLAAWWGAVLGVDSRGFSWLSGVPGMPWEMVFNPVPEPKRVKNRIHWHLQGRTEDAVAAGARLLRPAGDDIGWDVLADPDGNEFCVFSPAG